MNRILLFILLISITNLSFAQNDYLALKKGNKTIQRFWKNSYIAFQLKDGQWVKGIITKIENNSFDLKIEMITHSLFGSDTFHISDFHYPLSDIYAMPGKGLQIDYIDGGFKVNKSAGHVHWYWIKSGWLFRTGAIGHTVLYIANGIINNLSFSGINLGIAAGVFIAGVVLHKIYKPIFRLGKKYHLHSITTTPARA